MAGSPDFVLRDPIFGSGGKVSYTGTAGSATLPQNSQSVLVWLSTVGYVRVGGTATTADLPLPANAPIMIPIPTTVQTGGPITLSAVQDSSGGSMYYIAMAE